MRNEPKYRRRRKTAIAVVSMLSGFVGYLIAQATLTPRYMDTGGTSYWTTFAADKVFVTLASAAVGGFMLIWWFQTAAIQQDSDH